MENKRILILGAKDFPKIHCFDWDDEDLPNIPDFDIVILNVVSLSNSTPRELIQPNIHKGLEILLNSGGDLVAIGCPSRNIKVRKSYKPNEIAGVQDNYAWCPFQIKITNESGSSFKFSSDMFKEYFKYIKKWSYFFELKDNNLSIRYYVENRYNEYLAGLIDRRMPTRRTGDFMFLPCPTEISDIEAIDFILEKFHEIYQKTPPPNWTKLIQIPGLGKIQENVEINLHKIAQLSKEVDKLKKKESELISYRELIYETGTELENTVKEVFTLLGYKSKLPKYREEYIVEYDKRVGIIECKGNKKSIKRSDFRQLLDYLKEYEIDHKAEYKGILVGNAWRLKPLEERNKSETPIFPKGKDGVIDIAAKHDIALVSTIDLLNVFCEFLEGKIKGKDIMEKIFKAEGVVNFEV